MSDAAPLLHSGRQALAREDDAEALPLLQRAVRLAPDSPDGHMLLGICLWLSGRRDEAVRELERAVDLDPQSLRAHYNLGAALRLVGRLEEAAQHLEAAVSLDPSHQKAADALEALRSMLSREQPPDAEVEPPIDVAPEPAQGPDASVPEPAEARPRPERRASDWYDELVKQLQTIPRSPAPDEPAEADTKNDADQTSSGEG